MSQGWEPIAHISPLKPIELAPRVPITKAPLKTAYELEAEAAVEVVKAQRAKRIWEAVDAIASSGGGVVMQKEPLSDAPVEQETMIYISEGVRQVWNIPHYHLSDEWEGC